METSGLGYLSSEEEPWDERVWERHAVNGLAGWESDLLKVTLTIRLLGLPPTPTSRDVEVPEIGVLLTCRRDRILGATTNSQGRASPNTTRLVRTLLTLQLQFFDRGFLGLFWSLRVGGKKNRQGRAREEGETV